MDAVEFVYELKALYAGPNLKKISFNGVLAQIIKNKLDKVKLAPLKYEGVSNAIIDAHGFTKGDVYEVKEDGVYRIEGKL